MAATDFVWGRYPIQGADVPVKNTSGSAMTAGQLVKLDTTAGNLLGGGGTAIPVVLTSAVTDFPLGILVENIASNAIGRCQIEGIAVGIAAGAITAGNMVGPSGATNGDVTAYTATDPAIGQALNTTTTLADPVLIRIAPCRNA